MRRGKRRRSDPMAIPCQIDFKRLLIISCYVGIMLVAFGEAHSTSGWLIFGVAPVLWLDRHLFRLLPWKNTQRLLLAVLIRLGLFLGGALLAQRIAIGMLTVRESVYLGCVTTLSAFLLEVVLEVAISLANSRKGITSQQLRLRNLA